MCNSNAWMNQISMENRQRAKNKHPIVQAISIGELVFFGKSISLVFFKENHIRKPHNPFWSKIEMVVAFSNLKPPEKKFRFAIDKFDCVARFTPHRCLPIFASISFYFFFNFKQCTVHWHTFLIRVWSWVGRLRVYFGLSIFDSTTFSHSTSSHWMIAKHSFWCQKIPDAIRHMEYAQHVQRQLVIG